ncbi:carbohydrate-binding protein, partial [Pontiella sp.]|uniref:carbohydrate-binding protein n=1 Tax=Pontiella sp. TaxID=2837462 RepID=UPI00356132E9
TANLSIETPNNLQGICVGTLGDGRLQIGSYATLTATQNATVNSIVGDGGGNTGVVQQEGGAVVLNRLVIGSNSATGTYHIHSGNLTVLRESGGNSLFLATSGTGAGTFRISSGSLSTRGGVKLGSAAGGIGRFEVVGTHPSSIAIGSTGTVDGRWTQYAGSTLSVRIDKTTQGVTPIFIDDYGDNGGGDVVFEDGALLEVDFSAAFLNGGTFTVMEWEGDVTDNGLQFASSVDTNIWSFAVDAANKRLTVTAVGNPISRDFVHPGLAHNRADLERMRDMVAAKIEPYYTSYLELASHPGVSEDYVPTSLSMTAEERETMGDPLESEGWQAYRNALMWVITGEERHAELCVSIFNAWSGLKKNNATVPLSTARHWRLIEAAEIIRSTYDGWAEADIQAFKDMLVYPGYSNTTVPTDAIASGDVTLYWRVYQGDSARHGNQGIFCMRMLMAMGAFLDNEIMYDRGLRYLQGAPARDDDVAYPSGPSIISGVSSTNDYFIEYSRSGDGDTVTDYGYNEVMHNYIWPNGQNQEASRDQGHGYAGTSVLGTIAEIAWNQGDDLYGHLDNRLLLGMEYLHRYNLSYDVSFDDQTAPWDPTVENGGFIQRMDRSGRWFSLAINPYVGTDTNDVSRYARLAPVFESNLAHYRDRIGLSGDAIKWLERGFDYLTEQIGVEGASSPGDLAIHGGLTYRRVSPGDPIDGFTGDIPDYAMNALPMTIEAENYDYFALDGEGRTYHDRSIGNIGASYRLVEDVDLSAAAGGGYAIGSIEPGEWVTYTVSVPTTGFYDISICYASMAAGGTIQFSLNGTDVTGEESIPHGAPDSTGASDWKTRFIARNVPLTRGVQPLLVNFGGTSEAFLLDSLSIEQLGSALVVYKHTAGSTSPDLVSGGVSSSAGLGGSLGGTIATSIHQLSAASANGLPLSVPTTDFGYYFSYDLFSNGHTNEFRNLSVDAYAKEPDRRYQLSYIIEGQPEVFVTGGPVEPGDLTDAGNADVYDFPDFTTAADVEFRVYWQGDASGSSQARVYVDELRINSLENPVALAQTKFTPVNNPVPVILSGTDPGGADLGYAVTVPPAHGTLSGSAPDLIYSPATNYTGVDTVHFVVNNGTLTSEVAVVSIHVEDPLVLYEHTAGSTLPDLVAGGVGSSARLGGGLSGTIATTIDQLSVASGNNLPLSVAENNYGYYFAYDVFANGKTIAYEYLSIDAYAKGTDRRYRLSYIIAGEPEVFITGGSVAAGDASTDVGNFDDYDFADFATASDVEFRVYWQGDAADGYNARVYVDELRVFGSVSAYSVWAAGHALAGADALPDADAENGGIGDGYSNLAEFALGMDPAVADAGSRDWADAVNEGGTNWFDYVHYRRSDYAEAGLSYLLIDSTNLVDSVSHTNAQDQILVGPAVDGYEPVTNRYEADEAVRFIKLEIRQD